MQFFYRRGRGPARRRGAADGGDNTPGNYVPVRMCAPGNAAQRLIVGVPIGNDHIALARPSWEVHQTKNARKSRGVRGCRP